MQGGQQFTVERPAHEAKKFTFYRVKKAPKDSGIDPSRTEENGVVKCVFTPEAFVDIPVTISGSSQPLMISLAPSATVGDLKQKIQQKLNKSPDLNQILAQNDEALKNHMSVRSVLMYITCKALRKLLQFIAKHNSNISPTVCIRDNLPHSMGMLLPKVFSPLRNSESLSFGIACAGLYVLSCLKVLNLQWHEIVNCLVFPPLDNFGIWLFTSFNLLVFSRIFKLLIKISNYVFQ